MKFPMYEETKDKKYRDDPYRAVNFRVNEAGRLVCPNGKEFLFLRTEPVKGNQYGKTVELHQCEVAAAAHIDLNVTKADLTGSFG